MSDFDEITRQLLRTICEYSNGLIDKISFANRVHMLQGELERSLKSEITE
jgi:hypothetical protein